MSSDDLQQTTESNVVKHEPEFHFFVELYKKMIKDRDVDKLKAVGGVLEVAKALEVDVNYGLDTHSVNDELLSFQDREEVFGKNTMSVFKPQAPFSWTKGLLRHHLLTPLIITAIINTVLGLSFNQKKENLGWMDSAGIWTIVLVFIMTSLAMDYRDFLTRRIMNSGKDIFDVTVVRNGQEQLIKNSDLLVGDILVLTNDVTVAADGLLFVDNDLFINEEVVTGNSKPIRKKLVEDPFCRSGTQVTNGSGRILVSAVGGDSELGQIMKTVSDSTDYADKWMREGRGVVFWFNIAASCLGLVSFIVLFIRWIAHKKGFPVSEISDNGPVQFVILAIGIIVVELPDGLLLFVLFRFAYTTWVCSKDSMIFRTPDAFNWMSNISSTCFDKTGTLTENRMTIVEGWFQGTYFSQLPSVEELDPMSLELIIENASLNFEAFLNDKEIGSNKFVGNQTEYALLVMVKEFGANYLEVRLQERPHIVKNYGFSSDKKMSSVIVKHGDLLRLYNKGAAEMVLRKCTEYIDPSGSRNSMSVAKRVELEDTIESMDRQGLRSLALTYANLDCKQFNFSENGEPLDESAEGKRGFAEAPEEDLVLLAIVGINDPIREGASEVVEQFKKLGILPRMITGDSLETAKYVASECGILTSEGLAMNGAEFRRRAEEDVEGLRRDLSRLQVLARSSPSEKQRLVESLQSRGDTVAACGDGTNDARALKESHVGIAMGTNSTEVAREAADVVILNDDISSILTMYLWSRCVFLSFGEYFQFRLSVTLVVWIIVLVSVCVGGETPLNTHQFLWANFIIDTFVVLSFATESPPSRVPDDDNYRARRDPLNNGSYLVHILLQSLYQIIVIICTFYSLSSLFERYTGDDHDLVKMRKNSLMFNIFVFMQLFNSLNCRKMFNEYNIFEGLLNSPLSCVARIVTIALQLTVMLTPLKTLFKVTELNAWEWIYSIGISVVVIPLSTFIRYDAKTGIIGLGSRVEEILNSV